MIVRHAEPRDAEAVARVHVTTWREAYRGIVDQRVLDGLSDEDFRERWTRNLADPAPDVRKNWVAEVDGAVVGFGSAGRCRYEDLDRVAVGEVYAMYVLPSAWGRGAGRGLMDEALAFLRSSGRTAASLWVLTANVRARRFYEAAGFRADGATAVHPKGDAELHETRYRRSLEAP